MSKKQIALEVEKLKIERNRAVSSITLKIGFGILTFVFTSKFFLDSLKEMYTPIFSELLDWYVKLGLIIMDFIIAPLPPYFGYPLGIIAILVLVGIPSGLCGYAGYWLLGRIMEIARKETARIYDDGIKAIKKLSRR